MAPCPRPLRRMLSSHSSVSRTPPLCVLPQAPRDRNGSLRGHMYLLICILLPFPLSRGMAFPTPLSTSSTPPSKFVRALCIAAPRTLHARPRAGRGEGGGGRVCASGKST